MRLIGKRLHIAPIAPKLTSTGGIHLLEQYEGHQKLWKVLSVGNGVTEVKAGDCVLTGVYGSNLVQMGDGTRIIEQGECYAVITEPIAPH